MVWRDAISCLNRSQNILTSFIQFIPHIFIYTYISKIGKTLTLALSFFLSSIHIFPFQHKISLTKFIPLHTQFYYIKQKMLSPSHKIQQNNSNLSFYSQMENLPYSIKRTRECERAKRKNQRHAHFPVSSVLSLI